MAEENGAEKVVPPYVSYRTFRNYVDALKQNIPGRIDRSVLHQMSGGTQNQLIASFKSLGLIDEQGRRQEALTRLVNSERAERKAVLREILERTYPYLFSADADFDLAEATPKQFDDEFKESGATGQTVGKCKAFFLSAAKDADIPLSQHLMNRTRPNGDRKTTRK